MNKSSENQTLAIETKEISREQNPQRLNYKDKGNLISPEYLRNQITSVEQKASVLSHFRNPVQALIAKAREQYRSRGYEAAWTTLNTAENAINTMRQCETQLAQWKKEGHVTKSLEAMKTDNINTVNTAFRNFERDLLTPKQQEHHDPPKQSTDPNNDDKEMLRDLAEQQLSQVNTEISALRSEGVHISLSSDPIWEQIAAENYGDAIIDSGIAIRELAQIREKYGKTEIHNVTGLDEKEIQILRKIEPLEQVPERAHSKLDAHDIPTIESAIKELETFINTPKTELTLTLDHTQLIADDWDRMTIQLANHGKVPAKEVRLTFSDEFDTKWIKPVTISAGATISLDIGIRPKLKGKIPLEITAIYIDGRDKERRETHEFWIDVIEKSATLTSGTLFSPVGQFTPKQLPTDLSDRYTESEFIGKGGFARVFKAKRNDGKYVAVKIPISMDATTGRSFIAEMQNWTKLCHPNIVGLYDFNIMPMPYFEEELCDSALSEMKKPLETEEAALILFNICEGLKFAHKQKIIHRDLKPQNILLKKGVPKISDWGLSRILSSSSTTTTTSFTAYYAAPEQIGNKTKDERTDIWQLGVIFYELVTGLLPFNGDSMLEVITSIATERPTQPSVITPSSHHVESIIMKCLEKNPDKRYQSVLELQKNLALYLRVTYTELLKTSVSVQDYTRSAYYCGDLVMVNLFTGDMKSAYKYILDLVHYSKGDVKVEAQELSEQIKMRMEMGVTEIPDELIQKAELIVHQMNVKLRTYS